MLLHDNRRGTGLKDRDDGAQVRATLAADRRLVRHRLMLLRVTGWSHQHHVLAVKTCCEGVRRDVLPRVHHSLLRRRRLALVRVARRSGRRWPVQPRRRRRLGLRSGRI